MTYEILRDLGIISMLGAFITWVVITQFSQIKGIKFGVKALLRAQMISEYNKAVDKGFAPIYAKENFENMWKQYHNLGVNGVMDEIHRTYMTLPTERRNDHDEVV